MNSNRITQFASAKVQEARIRVGISSRSALSIRAIDIQWNRGIFIRLFAFVDGDVIGDP